MGKGIKMGKNQTYLIQIITIIFVPLLLLGFIHETVHIIQGYNSGIKEVCFVGYDPSTGTAGWVSYKDFKKDTYFKIFNAAFSKDELEAYGFSFVIALFITLYLISNYRIIRFEREKKCEQN